MARYRSKPSEIEAVRWVGDNLKNLEGFGAQIRERCATPTTLELLAGKDGAQGWVPLPVGHWIVRIPGDLSDHWPVDPDYFAAKYELVGK